MTGYDFLLFGSGLLFLATLYTLSKERPPYLPSLLYVE